MEIEKLKKLIEECFTIIWFKYDGIWGNVEPWIDTKTKTYTYAACYDGKNLNFHKIEDVIETPFIKGKSLKEIAEQIEEVDW